VPVFQTVPVAAEGGEGLWGLAHTVKAGVSRALKEGHVLGAIQEFTYYLATRHLTQYIVWETIVKVRRTSRPLAHALVSSLIGHRKGASVRLCTPQLDLACTS
jgi:hypothetical protein